mgnify:FL=1
MEYVKLTNDLKMSRIVHGLWRLDQWNLSSRELLRLIEETLDMGIDTFDHADIYGDYTCETLFGEILGLKPGLRKRMQVITKCGIKLLSEKFPKRRIKYYDTSYEHIVGSAEQSLKNLKTDYIDVLLIHRPDPLMDPEAVARAFEKLSTDGKVLHFGVSNFSPMQFEMLRRFYSGSLVTNQVEVSPYQLEHIHNGNLEYMIREGIRPMGWSPLSGGDIYQPGDKKGVRVKQRLQDLANRLGIDGIDKVIFAWILNHPAGIIPVAGTGKAERLKRAADALNIPLTREHWFEIYSASLGGEVP